MLFEDFIKSGNSCGCGEKMCFFSLGIKVARMDGWFPLGECLFGHQAVLLLALTVRRQDKVNTGSASPLGLSEIPCGIINHHLVEHLVLFAA